MSAGEKHILPEMMALENFVTGPGYSFWTRWWCFSTSNQTVPPYQTVTYYFPSGWQLLWWLYHHTLHQQNTYSVDAAIFAVTIWQILPMSEKRVYSTCFRCLSTSEIRPLSTLEQRTYTGRKLQYRATYDLGWRRNRMAKVQIPTNKFSQTGWKQLCCRARKDPAKSSCSLLWFLRALNWPHPRLRLSNTKFNPELVSFLQIKINQIKQAVNVVLYLHRKSLYCVEAAEHLLWTPHNSCTFLHLLSTQKKT